MIVSELAERLDVTKQSASLLTLELQRRGYVTRRMKTMDARMTLIVLTDRGRSCVAAADEFFFQAEWRLRDRFGAGGPPGRRYSLAQ